MSRWLKALPLALALAALSIFGGSCGSSSPAQVRFVHAIQDASAMDIQVNGTAEFTNLSFLGVQPNQPGYTNVPSGGDTIQGFVTGTTTKVFTDTATLSASARYTLVATGFSLPIGSNGSNVDLLQISDNIPTPPAGDVAFRVVHASPSGPNGNPDAPEAVDVYILLNPSTGPTGNPTISALAYTQASGYVSIPNNPNNDTMPPGFMVYVTAVGSTQVACSGPINPQAGAVRTLVLTDVQDGNKMDSTFLELSDLN
jgi:hypothetical protein